MLAEIRSGLPAELHDQVLVKEVTRTALSSKRIDDRGNPFSDKEYKTTSTCQMTIEVPTVIEVECDCTSWLCVAPGCGARPEILASPVGLTRAELEAQSSTVAAEPPPQCSTCDTLPMDTPEAAQAKLGCLQNARALADPATAAQLGARTRVLFLLEADKLSAAARAAAWESFAPEALATTLDCEPSSAPVVVAPGCPADLAATLQRDVAGCGRIAAGLGNDVRASVAWVTADRCIGLLERLQRAGDPQSLAHRCTTTELAAGARTTMARLLLGALDALQERGSLGPAASTESEPHPELERTLWLLDRWYTAERALAVELDGGPERGDPERVLHNMTKAFWAAAQKARGITSDLEALLAGGVAAETEVAAALLETSARADRLDRDVVQAAYRGASASIAAVQLAGEEILPPVTIDGAVVHGDLLVALTGDAVTGLSRGLERATPFHDLACRFAGCGSGASPALRDTQQSLLWRALAALDRDVDGPGGQEGLATVVARMPGDMLWRPAFAAILENQSALRDALATAALDASGLSPLADADASELSAEVLPLATRVRVADERARQYRVTGTLSLPGRRRIHANVSAAGRRATLEAFDAARSTFSNDLARYQSERRAAVSDALQGAQVERALDAARQRLRTLDRELARLNSDALGLSDTLLALDQGVGRVAERIADIEGALDTGGFVDVGPTRRFTVHGFDGSRAVHAEAEPTDIGAFAAPGIEVGGAGPAVIPVAANQLVSVQASGEYSPLCALSRLAGGQAGRVPVSLEGVLDTAVLKRPGGVAFAPNPSTTVGPEGFNLVQEADRAVARSRNKKSSGGGLGTVLGTVGSVFSASGNPAAMVAGAAIGGIGSLLGANGKSKSSSSSQRDFVRFQGGLRLADTPFPALPAGALLLVELPRGATDTSAIRAIHPVERPATSFVADADADLYFVVNDHFVAADPDCRRMSPPDDPNAVTVAVRLATPNTVAAERSIRALREVTDGVRAEREALLEQGRVDPNQLGQILADAQLDLHVESSSLPEALREMIRAHLSREVAAIEVAVNRLALERRGSDIALEAEGLLREVASLQASETTMSLLPAFRLRTFAEFNDGVEERSLVDSAEQLLARGSETVLPILELWHPEVLRRARANPKFQRDAQTLTNLAPDADPFALADQVDNMMKYLRAEYEKDPITHFDSSLNQPIVALSFPRPAVWDPPCEGCIPSTSGLLQASEARAYAVWNAVEAALLSADPPSVACESTADCVALPGTYCPLEGTDRHCARASTRVELGLEVDDVYRVRGGQATLSCTLATPVVQQWGLLFANQGDDFADELSQLSRTRRYLEPRAQSTQLFVTESGLRDYEMTERASLASRISLLYSSDEDVLSTFQGLLANEHLLSGRNPVGLSAFSRLSVDFAELARMHHSFGDGIGRAADRAVSELILLMRLDARTLTSDPPDRGLEGIVGSCTGGASL